MGWRVRPEYLRRPPQSVAAKPARGALRRASAAASSAGFEARARTRALRQLTSRRECLSVESAANEASFAARPRTEHRRAIGARSATTAEVAPPPGTACREFHRRAWAGDEGDELMNGACTVSP